jgi:hypothetical protein
MYKESNTSQEELMSRREWMGVEPTAARNATRHRF